MFYPSPPQKRGVMLQPYLPITATHLCLQGGRCREVRLYNCLPLLEMAKVAYIKSLIRSFLLSPTEWIGSCSISPGLSPRRRQRTLFSLRFRWQCCCSYLQGDWRTSSPNWTSLPKLGYQRLDLSLMSSISFLWWTCLILFPIQSTEIRKRCLDF